MRVRMVSASEPFSPAKHSLKRGDGRQALTAHRSVLFDGAPHRTPVYDRKALCPGDTFAGPAIVTEYSSATVLPPGDSLHVDAFENLIIEVHG